VTSKNTYAESSVGEAFLAQARDFLKGDYLPKLERCLVELTDEQIWWRPGSESNSIGNLLLHLAGNARQWIISGLGGEIDERVRSQEFDESNLIPGSDLISDLRQTIEQVDAVLARFDSQRILDHFRIQGTEVTALEAIFHVTEHFSMHTGQIIFVTKMLSHSGLNFYHFSNGAPVHVWRNAEQKRR